MQNTINSYDGKVVQKDEYHSTPPLTPEQQRLQEDVIASKVAEGIAAYKAEEEKKVIFSPGENQEIIAAIRDAPSECDRHILILERKLISAKTSADFESVSNMLTEAIKQKAALEETNYQRGQQVKREAELFLTTLFAAALTGIPGYALIVATVATGHVEFTVAGGPLIAIAAAALSARAADVAKIWLAHKGANDGKNQ